MKETLIRKRIWVTGASSGIGKSLAEELLKMGNSVALSARRTDALRELAASYPDRALVVPLDVLSSSSVKHAAKKIRSSFDGLDIAILNAGTCEYIDSRQFSSECIDRVVSVNLVGFARCVEASLPLLRLGEFPLLAGVSSTVAFAPLPRAEAYGASKAAVSYLLESLRADLTPEGIDVSVIYPGFVKTPLTDRNDFPMPMMISTDESTRHIINGLRSHKKQICYPRVFSLLIRVLGLLPTGIRNRINQKMIKESSQ